jgi:hypothetical protein
MAEFATHRESTASAITLNFPSIVGSFASDISRAIRDYTTAIISGPFIPVRLRLGAPIVGLVRHRENQSLTMSA